MAHAWQVDYGGTAQELEAYFNHCGEIHRVTILCDKFSGHPKGSVWGLGEGTSRKGPVPGENSCAWVSIALTVPCSIPAMPT